MQFRNLFRARTRKPLGVLRWNLMFLLWSAILLVALTQADLFEHAVQDGAGSPDVSVQPLPEPAPLKDEGRHPLQAQSSETEPSPLEAVAALMPSNARPDYPLVGAAYHNPGYDPVIGIKHYSQASLAWLTHHQNAEGFWSAAHFGDNSCREGAAVTGADDAGPWNGDLACTSLALLSYVGAGWDHKEGEFKRNIRQAIIWLRANQDEYGFKSARGIRDHALAVMALCEAYGLSGDQVLKPIADKAVRQLLSMREADSGWGEYSGYPADTISTAYAMLAIKTVRMSGLEVDDNLPGLAEFLEFVHGGDYVCFSVDTEPPPSSSKEGFTRPPVCAAAWVLTSLFSGATLKDERINQCATVLAKPENLPTWERGKIDFEYWWLGFMAACQLGGKTWKVWEAALSGTLVENQRGWTAGDKQAGLIDAIKLDEHGSWDAADIWSTDGRVAATAMARLCLEVYYRYARLADLSNEVIK